MGFINNIKAFQTVDQSKLWKTEFSMQFLSAGGQGHPETTEELKEG